MATILSVLNYKGGVAKTTTTANLGTALWILGKRVLLIDTDPQCDLTFLLGFDGAAGDETFNEWFMQQNDEGSAPVYVRYDAIDKRYDSKERLYYIPSSRELRDADMMLAARKARERILKRKLKPLQDAFDYILIDCSPKESIVNFNAMVVSDRVLVPIDCSGFSLKGMQTLIDSINEVKDDEFNENLDILGFLPIRYDRNTRISKSVIEYFESQFPGKVFKTKIRKSVRFDESPLKHKTIFEYDPEGNGAEDYMSLAEEITGEKRPEDWQCRALEAWYMKNPDERPIDNNEN